MVRPDWEHENPDDIEDDPLCAVCLRDNRHGTHYALERTGHLSHEFITVLEVRLMAQTDPDSLASLRERLLSRGVAIVSGSPLYIAESAQERPAEPHDELSLHDFQDAVGAWCRRNFGIQSDLVLYGGTAEECGEMLRGAVKREQGIRGTREEWNQIIRDEMGDVVIKLASAAAQEGWSLSDIIRERWATVQQRDWTINRVGHGLPEDD